MLSYLKCTLAVQYFKPAYSPIGLLYISSHIQPIFRFTDSRSVKYRLWFLKMLKMSRGDCKYYPFILITRCLLAAEYKKGLSGAVKRAYCCIPALTTATSQGFPFHNNRHLILPNAQTAYLFGRKIYCLQCLQTPNSR